jgi:two-component system response regulator AtoC
MHKLAKHYGLPPRGFSSTVLDACRHYAWPGNLRELETFVKRYLVAGDQQLAFGEMGLEPAARSSNPSASRVVRLAATAWEERNLGEKQPEPESLKSLIQGIKSEAEKNAIGAALKKTGWNRKAAARLLRVSYRTLLYKIEQYQMRAPDVFLSPPPVEEFSVYGGESKRNGKAS